MAAMMSMPLLGFQLEAIYHTAIVYNGVEFYFGGGGRGGYFDIITFLQN